MIYMEITLLLAKMFGAYFVIMGIAIFTRKEEWKEFFREFMDNKHVSFVLGFLVLILGMVLVSLHNIWDGGFNTTIITIFSWIVLLKGIAFFLLPKNLFSKWIKSFLGKGFTSWMVAIFVIGVYLLMFGYGVI